MTARAGESVVLRYERGHPVAGQPPPYVVEWFKFGVPIPIFIKSSATTRLMWTLNMQVRAAPLLASCLAPGGPALSLLRVMCACLTSASFPMGLLSLFSESLPLSSHPLHSGKVLIKWREEGQGGGADTQGFLNSLTDPQGLLRALNQKEKEAGPQRGRGGWLERLSRSS